MSDKNNKQLTTSDPIHNRLMRRKLAWVGGSILVLGLTLLAAAFLLGNNVQFRFLEGRTPVRIPETLQKYATKYGGYITVYSFKADFGALMKRAIAELKREGYKDLYEGQVPISTPSPHVYFGKGDLPAVGHWILSPKMRAFDTVMIEMDHRFLLIGSGSNARLVPTNAPGWVSVTLTGKRETNFLTKLREWLGL